MPEPNWSAPENYHLSVREIDPPGRPGEIAYMFCVTFAVAAAGAYGWAEFFWMTVEPTGSGLQAGFGIGSSGYATTLYMRAVALAAVSVACGVVGLMQRRPGDYRTVLWRGAPESRPPDGQ